MNKKYSKKFRKYWVFCFAILMLVLVILFWFKVFFENRDNSNLLFSSEQSRKEGDSLDAKIKDTVSTYSCEAKDEKLFKGYIEKIEADYLVVTNGVEQAKIFLKPETVFVKISVFPDGKIISAEISKKDLKINQDVVVSAFLSADNFYYSLLIKQINLVI